LLYYRPYEKQAEFHDAGATARERLLCAGNRIGKTHCGASELAMHLTGFYPDWWKGKRFDKEVRAWAAGVTNESTRDVVQEKLIGPPFRRAEWGHGLIPKDRLGEFSMARGTPDLIDTISIRHESGGYSTLQFKSYAEGREKWQGVGLEVCWLDEECPEQLYLEAITRTNETRGIVFTTFTPMQGGTTLVNRFFNEDSADRHVTTATIWDAEHFTDEDRERIEASYPDYERDARTRGIPTLGSGRVFEISEDDIRCDPVWPLPRHWGQIIGVDFGYTHPAATVLLAHDRDKDIVYVAKAHRASRMTPREHAEIIRGFAPDVPVAWPHDGQNKTMAGSGEPLAKQYRLYGVDMLHQRAEHDDGSIAVEPALLGMLDRMHSGKLRVFADINQDFWTEFRMYHRKDGKVVALNDDIMAALRYGYVMLRFARTPGMMTNFRRQIEYPNRGYV
jgi:phage terminase large subunit-like protein